jgi:predicted transcriptional regulator
MSTAREDLDQFHQFAAKRLADELATVSLDDLYAQWHDHRHRDEVNRAIRQGLADVDAGRFQPADQAMEKIRQQFGFAQP